MAIAIVVDGAPFFGSDVGGVLSMVPAYAVTATLLLGWRIRWKLIALYAGRRVLLIALFAAIDLSRPASKRTHLGRLIASGEGQGGFHNIATVHPAQDLGEHRRVVRLDLDDHAPGRARRHRVPHLPRAGPDARVARAHPATLGRARGAR